MSHQHGATSFWGELAISLAIITLFVVYLWAAWQLRSRRGWSWLRSVSFASGIVLVLLGLSPTLTAMAQHDLRGHMLQHLLIGMFAPIGLVLGAPFTLALRTLSVPDARRLSAFFRWRPMRWLSHPLTGFVFSIGAMYLLYATPLFAASQEQALLHSLLHIHFLAAGFLFTWSLIGIDSAPHRPRLRMRLVVLFLAGAAHAILAKAMYIYLWPLGVAADAEQIRTAAKLMYYGGDLAEIVLLIVLFAQWYRNPRCQRDLASQTVSVLPSK